LISVLSRKAVAWRNEMVAREDEEAGKGEDGVVRVTRVLLPRVSIVPSEERQSPPCHRAEIPDVVASIDTHWLLHLCEL
jgi:hypothetical protein